MLKVFLLSTNKYSIVGDNIQAIRGDNKMPRKAFNNPKEAKAEVIEEIVLSHLGGKGVDELSKEYNYPIRAIEEWVEVYTKGGGTALAEYIFCQTGVSLVKVILYHIGVYLTYQLRGRKPERCHKCGSDRVVKNGSYEVINWLLFIFFFLSGTSFEFSKVKLQGISVVIVEKLSTHF